jgi:hypothetical protein
MVIEYQGIAAERGVTRHDIADHLGRRSRRTNGRNAAISSRGSVADGVANCAFANP